MADEKYKHIGHPAVRTIEECVELIKALTKAQRFGWWNHHPDHPGRTNLSDVLSEILDVRAVIDELEIYLKTEGGDKNEKQASSDHR